MKNRRQEEDAYKYAKAFGEFAQKHGDFVAGQLALGLSMASILGNVSDVERSSLLLAQNLNAAFCGSRLGLELTPDDVRELFASAKLEEMRGDVGALNYLLALVIVEARRIKNRDAARRFFSAGLVACRAGFDTLAAHEAFTVEQAADSASEALKAFKG